METKLSPAQLVQGWVLLTEPELKTDPRFPQDEPTLNCGYGVQKALKLSPAQQVQLCKVHLMVQADLERLKQRRGQALAALTVCRSFRTPLEKFVVLMLF